MMVARDGIEPPTPAFSGLASAKAIMLILRGLAQLKATFRPVYWTHNGRNRRVLVLRLTSLARIVERCQLQT
jgi:hypothetical protein